MKKQTCIALLMFLFLGSSSFADLIVYRIDGLGGLPIVLRGTLKTNPGGTSTFRHPKFGTLYMRSAEVAEKYKVPDDNTLYKKLIDSVKTAEDAMEASQFALRHGMTDKVYEAAGKALQLDPNHVGANKIKSLYQLIRRPLEESDEEEQLLRKTVRLNSMKIAKSAHYILLHDTSDKKTEGKGSNMYTRADARLQLLEKVYESFLLKFYSKGVELELPKKRLMVVLFQDSDDYYNFSAQLDPSLASTLGFWDPVSNIAFFFDNGSSKRFQGLRDMAASLQRQKEQVKKDRKFIANVAEIVRAADTVSLLVKIDQENADIEVVSHECTHQMAGNTGLFPRHVRIPQWIHEGLATYFESPADASWSGIGAVNEDRLTMYRALAEGDKEHSNVDFIVGDQIFKFAGSHGSILHGYAQAWALTHFLVEEHFEEFMEFYGRLGEMPPDIILSPEMLTALFDDTFKTDRQTLNLQWRQYMKGLKTDMELITKGAGGGSFR